MRSEQTKKLLFNFNQRLNKIVVDRAHAILQFKNTKSNFFIASIIGKAIKTHSAILMLCINGYGEDASVLTRSLFEMLLDVKYILKENTEERLSRYWDHNWKIKELYLQALSKHFGNAGYDEAQVNEDEREKIIGEAARVKQKNNYKGNGWSDKNRREMAKDVGMLADYDITYKMMSGLTHTDSLGLDSYASLDKNGNPFINMEPSDKYVNETLVSAFEYFFNLVDKWNELLELAMDDDIKKFADEYSTFMKATKSS